MSKKKGIITLVCVIAFLLAGTWTAVFGLDSAKTGSAANIKQGLDLAGGVSITYQVVGDEAPSSEDMADTIYKLQQRVDNYSTEAQVYQEGSDRINIEIPGVTDANAILEELGKPGSLTFLDKDGNLPRANRALLADAIATSAGAVLGTSTVTTYVESSSGIAEGGKTGLTSLTTGICFLLAIVAMPLLGFVPTGATAPILIIVGVMMCGSLKEIDWADIEIAIPAFFTLVMMPFGYSIADGIAFGCISYTVIKIVRGQAAKVHPVMYVISILFLLRYIIQVIPMPQ